MKKLSKITKTWMKFLMMTIMIFSSIMKVEAVEDTIQLGAATQTKSYIAGVTFSYKVTTSGQYLYCLNIHKTTAQNIQAKLIKNSANINGGVVYILKNGYPLKSITGDKDKDYYITQTALWWYLDRTTGSTNLGEQFKQTGSDTYDLRKHVKQLMEDAYLHRNDSIGVGEVKLNLSAVNGNTLSLNKNYYVSNDIKATSSNISEYTVTLTDAPKGTVIVSSNGTESNYTKSFNIKANDSFKVKVPYTSITGTEMNIKVKATATGTEQYMAYEYQPVDTNMQNVALLEKTSSTVSSDLTLEIVSSKVTVVKIDSSTKQPLSGAKLVLKDSTGKVLTSWTSTNNGHIIRNLANGTYTIEETEAPNGYLINNNKKTFTISDTNRDIQINMENTAKKVVVNITKVDQETHAPLSGAVLAVKNSSGVEIARFTTTENAYVLTDLANGTYTIVEISAPLGYTKREDVIQFTIDDNHLTHQIAFANTKEVIVSVPDTASFSSIILLILGIGILGIGTVFIYKNAKR